MYSYRMLIPLYSSDVLKYNLVLSYSHTYPSTIIVCYTVICCCHIYSQICPFYPSGVLWVSYGAVTSSHVCPSTLLVGYRCSMLLWYLQSHMPLYVSGLCHMVLSYLWSHLPLYPYGVLDCLMVLSYLQSHMPLYLCGLCHMVLSYLWSHILLYSSGVLVSYECVISTVTYAPLPSWCGIIIWFCHIYIHIRLSTLLVC